MGASTSNRITIDPQGRIVIPAEIRKARGWKPGDRMVLREIDGKIVLMSYFEALDLAREMASKFLPSDRSLVDELIAERRAAAARGD
jgi:AbrB family looped-hinge helix DNA binding protein